MAMESNRGEASRCVQRAVEALRQTRADPEQARRLLEKAQRLFPTAQARDLLESLEQKGNHPEETAGSPVSGDDSGARHRNHGSPANHTPGQRGADPAKPYTSDQLDAVKKIKSCKNYYEILGLDKEASEEDLKRSYRKLALKFHPDKNQAPGATEAFKAIGNAYAVLSNPDKRRQYDQHGEEAAHPARHRHQRQGFEADISPEDLFNMFFGGGFPSSNVHVYRNGRMHFGHQQRQERRGDQQRDGGLGLLVQLMPLLILIIVSALSQMMATPPPYSLSPRLSVGHTHRRQTTSLKVPYYVGEGFGEEYSGRNLATVERSVEEDYISNLRNSCWKERQNKEGLLYRARYFGDSELYQRAQSMTTPSCSRLAEVQILLHA